MADVGMRAGGGSTTQRETDDEVSARLRAHDSASAEWRNARGHAAQEALASAYRQAQHERIANPATNTPLESYPEYMARRAHEAVTRDFAGYATDRNGKSQRMGEVRGGNSGFSDIPTLGNAQMHRAPGKMFSRETICAIIRGQMAITHDSHLRDLLTIFENLE